LSAIDRCGIIYLTLDFIANARYGADFKLDVVPYRLDQQVACQRYRQTILIATRDKIAALNAKAYAGLASVFAAPKLAAQVA
jgi:hypothetical protein